MGRFVGVLPEQGESGGSAKRRAENPTRPTAGSDHGGTVAGLGGDGSLDPDVARHVLVEVLRNREYTRALLEFVVHGWPTNASRLAALSHLHLFLDIEDLRKFSECEFRDVLARNIYAHYLQHGTDETVYASSMAARAAQEVLESCEDAGARVPVGVFDEIQQDCFGFLLGEVVPQFYQAPEPFGYKFSCYQGRTRRSEPPSSSAAQAEKKPARSTQVAPSDSTSNDGAASAAAAAAAAAAASASAAKQRAATPAQKQTPVQIITAIAADTKKLAKLRSVVSADREDALLAFVLETFDMDNLAHELQSAARGGGGEESAADHSFLMSLSARLYRTYVRPDAPLAVDLGQDVVRMTRRALMRMPEQSLEGVFGHAQQVGASALVANYVDADTGRVAAVGSPAGSRSSSRRWSAGSMSDTEDGDARTDSLPPGFSLDVLLRKPNSAVFMRYMESVRREGVLLFALEADNYRSIPRDQGEFRKAVARKMFDKFVRRAATAGARLEAPVAASIVRRMGEAAPDLYDDALNAVRADMSRYDVPSFLKHELFNEIVLDVDRFKGGAGGGSGGEDDEDGGGGGNSQAGSRRASERGANIRQLKDVLLSQHMCPYFRRFATLEFCDSLVAFWLEVEDVKRLPQCEFQALRCRKLVRRYVQRGAPAPLPISEAAREAAIDHDHSPNAFRAAQDEVLVALAEQVFPRFLESALFKEMRRANPRRRASFSGLEGIEAARVAAAAAGGAGGGGGHGLGGLGAAAGAGLEPAPERTLAELLLDPRGCAFFVEFCKQNRCEENVLFWMDVQELQVIPSDGYMRMRAYKMGRKYFGQRATMQINVADRIATEIQANLHAPTRAMFNKAQQEILVLMEKDTYPRFLKSAQHAEYMATLTTSGPQPMGASFPGGGASGGGRRRLPPIAQFRKSSTVQPVSFQENSSGRSGSRLEASKSRREG